MTGALNRPFSNWISSLLQWEFSFKTIHLKIFFKNHFTLVLGLRTNIFSSELNFFPTVVTKHFVQIMKPAKIGVQNVTIYSQFSICTSLHDTGNYVVTKLLMSLKIDQWKYVQNSTIQSLLRKLTPDVFTEELEIIFPITGWYSVERLGWV